MLNIHGSKERYETRNNVSLDEIDKAVQRFINAAISRERILKRYEIPLVNEVHLHFVRVDKSVEGDRRDYCAMMTNLRTNIGEAGHNRAGIAQIHLPVSKNGRGQHKCSVLIDVHKRIQSPQGMELVRIPVEVRLKSFDVLDGVRGNSCESISSNLATEIVFLPTNRELVIVRSSARIQGIGVGKVPNQMIQRRAKIIKTISYDNAKQGWGLRETGDKLNALCVDIIPADDATHILMPHNFGSYCCEVFFGSNNLVSNAVERVDHEAIK